MMCTYFKSICLLWIICYICITDENDATYKIDSTVKNEMADKNDTSVPPCPGKFNVTPLGHSNLLITWQLDENSRHYYKFEYKPDGNNSWNKDVKINVGEDGWHKMNSYLEENTLYQIKIKDQNSKDECFFLAKTNSKTNSFPAKPDFKVSMMKELEKFHFGRKLFSSLPKVRIEWLPCGKNKFCEADEIAGVDFSIKYKMLDSKQEWNIIEKYAPYKYIYGLLPGREYEVVVTSIYDDLKSDSDPQLISIPAFCSPVRSVKIISLPDSSVLISWKSPKQCQPVDVELRYTIFYHVLNQNPVISLNYSFGRTPYPYQEYITAINDRPFKSQLGVEWQVKLSNLTIGTPYTFFIVPYSYRDFHHGFEYRIDYTPKLYKADLPLAKPEFEYMLSSYEYVKSKCTLHILWLPCGQTLKCKNTKPGSYYVVKYREGNGVINEQKEGKSDRATLAISMNQEYEVWVESVVQSDREKSKSKIIDTSKCKVNSK